MHHSGGAGGRKYAVRCFLVRQRCMRALAASTRSRSFEKTGQRRTPSLLKCERMKRPSGLKLALIKPLLWPSRRAISLNVIASHIRIDPSSERDIRFSPSGLKAVPSTAASLLKIVAIASPFAAFHTRILWSFEAVTILVPSGLKAASFIESLWPERSRVCSPV